MSDRTRWTDEQHELAEYEVECAYWHGFRDGYARCDADVVAVLAGALGGPGCADYREAVARHHREVERRHARAAWDEAARLARPDERRRPAGGRQAGAGGAGEC